MLYYQIKALYPDIKDSEFELANYGDGKGDQIQSWYSNDYPKPTQEQLDAVETSSNQLQQLTIVQKKRAANYRPIGDQLDDLYKAIKAGDTNFTAFVAAIDAVKTAYPKPL